jgi:LmbE family N-acetylglucosaminyl deacetylase
VSVDTLLDAKRILVLAPHPDDETLGCGGTIAICGARGAEVRVAVISDGGKIMPAEDDDARADIVALRKAEAQEACRILGVKEMSFLGYPDGDLKGHTGGIRADVSELLDRFRPEIVLSPSPLDYHEDHIAVSKIAAEIVMGRDGLQLAFFQVYGTLRFNSLVDIGSVLGTKEKAILCYRQSLFGDPGLFAEAVRGTSAFWSFYSRIRGYCEAFFVVPPSFDRAAIVHWLTYGEKESTAEEIFLDRLKTVDELLLELKKKEALVEERGKEIETLKSLAEEKERNTLPYLSELAARKEELASNARRLEEVEQSLAKINGSIFWRIATRFYRARDRALPERSPGRRIYNSLISRIKRW